jgi:hypothetical protein
MSIIHLAQSFQRKHSYQRLTDLSVQVCTHLILILLLPGDRDQNHWRKELSSWLAKAHEYAFIKDSFLTEEDFLNTLFHFSSEKETKFLVGRLRNKYKRIKPQSNEDLQNLQRSLTSIYNRLAGQLSQPEDVRWKRFLEEIIPL